MNTAEAQQAADEGPKSVNSLTRWWTRVVQLRPRGLQFQLIVPYLMLTLALAAIGVFIITRLVVDSETDAFANRMAEASRVASDAIVKQERDQLEELRLFVWSEGMAEAITNNDSDKILENIRAIVVNNEVNVVTVLDKTGSEIVTLGLDPAAREYRISSGNQFSGLPFVSKVLQGEIDNEGDKYVEFVRLAQGWTMFTNSPVLDENNQLVGVILTGTYMDRVISQLRTQTTSDYILFLNLENELIATDLEEPVEGYDSLLSGLQSYDETANITQFVDAEINRRQYEIAYSPLIIRSQRVGWMGVVMNKELLVSNILVSRTMFIILFTVGAMAMFGLGYYLANKIARPILQLRDLSTAIAKGDLNQNIGLRQDDEIGELAEAFDIMAVNLRERTELAARLYAETVQRNKELVEINYKLEQTQLQLIQSEKLASIGQLTAGIVHDVKNPFAVIMGMAEMLAEDEALDETTRHSARVMRESAIKGNKIVTDLLKFARQQKPEMRYGDLRETIDASIRLTAYLTRRYNLVKELPDMAVMMMFDSQQIEQVLINMINNSLHAMPNGGTLRLTLQQSDGNARIIVQDSGCGIPHEYMRRIFDPFFTTKPEGQGTGLGLSVSYGIIKNHGGNIDVESEIDKGTTFTITIPVVHPNLSEGDMTT